MLFLWQIAQQRPNINQLVIQCSVQSEVMYCPLLTVYIIATSWNLQCTLNPFRIQLSFSRVSIHFPTRLIHISTSGSNTFITRLSPITPFSFLVLSLFISICTFVTQFVYSLLSHKRFISHTRHRACRQGNLIHFFSLLVVMLSI